MSIPDQTGREASAARPGALLPPFSEEAEAIALGAVLLDPETMLDLCRVHQLVPESFYLSGHRTIYEAMLELAASHRPIEIPALVELLTQTGRLEAAGGEDALLSIVSRATSVAYAEYYIKRVFENHLLRRVLDAAREVTESCYRADLGAEGVLERAESAFFSLSENRAGTEKSWRDLVKQEMVEAERLLSEKKSLTGISTGFVDIDAKLLGMQKSDLLILAARPSMGKTSLALNIAENVATGARRQTPLPVAVFSLDMSAAALVRRMICCRARVSAKDLSTGRLGAGDHAQLVQAADELSRAPIYVDDTAGLEVEELRSRSRRLKRKYGIQFIVVDYLQLLNCSARARDGRQQETAAISQNLKAMAKELQVPVLVLSQFSRAPENRGKEAIPKLSDLRDSGAIEQDADIVFLLRRPSYYKEGKDSDDLTLAIVDVAKHRNGPTGEVRLNFFSDYTRFDNRIEAPGADE